VLRRQQSAEVRGVARTLGDVPGKGQVRNAAQGKPFIGGLKQLTQTK
jgi:hypothetical protein